MAIIKKQLVNIDYLVERIIEHNDEGAFKTLFYHLVPKLYSYATYIIGHRHIAEEIASDVMVKFWMNRREIKTGPRIKNYFFICTKNLAFNYLRDHTKRHFVGLEHIGSKDLLKFENAENALLNDELKNVISEAILQLPEKCKLVFQLVKEEQMTYKEVGELLDISTKTVENQMSKALLRIRMAIDQYRSAGNWKIQIMRSVLLFSMVF